jgi:hypothetical protein
VSCVSSGKERLAAKASATMAILVFGNE